MNTNRIPISIFALVFPLIAAAATGNTPPGRELPPATQTRTSPTEPPPVVTANPGIKVAHTKITSLLLSSTNLTVGMPLTVKVGGSGNETQCPAAVVIMKNGSYYKVGPTQVATGAWPRVSTFTLTESGNYVVRISMTEGGVPQTAAEREACLGIGSGGLSSVLGDGTKFQISDIPK